MENFEKLNKKIPQYPYLKSRIGCKKKDRQSVCIPTVLDSGKAYAFLNGRSALEIGLRCLMPNESDEVLVPAYQCPVALHAIVRAGLKPHFYRLNNDCTANFFDLENKISKKTRAIIVVHYFGFPSPIKKIADLCNQNNLVLIEDCAHAFFGENHGKPLGSFADFSIASLYKFFPVYLGGYLVVRNKKILDKLDKFKYAKSSVFFQIKSAVNTLEMGCDFDESLLIRKRIFAIKDRILTHIKQSRKKTVYTQQTVNADNPFAPEIINKTYSSKQIPLFSKGIHAVSDCETIIYKRRENYQYLMDKSHLKLGLHPLKPELPPRVVPYNFPVVLRNANKVSRKLRDKQIKIARFAEYLGDGLDKNEFPIASRYAANCIQLPIHQSLTKKDLNYILDSL